MYAKVLIEIKAKSVDKTFTYIIPKNMNVQIGMRVLVPFGKRNLEGFVLEKCNDLNIDYKVKEIIKCIDEKPVINKEMLELGKYISKKTMSPLISAYQTMLPKALKASKNTKINKKYIAYLKIIKKEDLKGKQKEVYDYISKNKKVLKKDANKISQYATKTLLEKKIIKEEKEEIYRLKEEENIKKEEYPLTLEQKEVISKVNINNFKPYLLHGVTGSGKTLVYIKLIEKVLKINKNAILLVPEISLTPQLVRTFKSYFGKVVAIMHSALSEGEKYDEWRKVEREEASIVIGARSAIFAPFKNLGIIIIDEEHSATYKQENVPKYNTVDIALWRAKKYNIPLILGSATPSIESYTRAKLKIYELLEMKERVNKSFPKITLVEMREEFKKGNRVFSELLTNKVNERLKNNEQIIILLNRRGYSTTISCKECGFVHKCPNCDIPLTYHKKENKMLCHYCNYTTFKLSQCPNCRSKNINEFGMGTEKLEKLITETFPLAKVLRMDNDTTRKKGMHQFIITEFESQKYNVLVGTQMIAKGLDFPNVTLVCVINGDSSLNIPDFRSAERTYQLLSQVSGRAGRKDKKGEVIIQGFNTNHYSMVMVSKRNYQGFYTEEIKIRKILKYPPFYNLVAIKISGKNLELVTNEAGKIANYLRKNLNNIILGPSPAMIPKQNNIYYMGIIIKYKKAIEVWETLKFINDRYSISKISVYIDLNPINI